MKTLIRITTDKPVVVGDLLPDYLGGKVKLIGFAGDQLVVRDLPGTRHEHTDRRLPALCDCHWV